MVEQTGYTNTEIQLYFYFFFYRRPVYEPGHVGIVITPSTLENIAS
jgi:hypothetical protein